MKINNLNDKKATLKEQAQRICDSIAKFDVLNNEKLLYQIQSKILNEANQGVKQLTVYVCKTPKDSKNTYNFTNSNFVIDLDDYPTTTVKEVCDELVTWLQNPSQGFLSQDIFLCISENEPIIGTITIQW